MTENAEAVIIGGGVIGVSIAYYLARRNFGRIVLLERATLGNGSTGRSVASVDLFAFQPAVLELQVRSQAVFRRCVERLGQSCGFVQTGFAVLAGLEQAAMVEKAAAAAQAAGIEAHLLSPAGFAALEPAAAVEDLALVCYVPGGGYGDPALTTQALATAAQRSGVVIRQGRAVTDLRYEGERVAGVETGAGPIAAPVVVCAAGPWNERLLGAAGYDLGLWSCRHSVACLHDPANLGRPGLSLLDLSQQIYARPETGALTLVGSIDPAVGYDPAEPDDDHGRVTPAYTFWAVERLVRRYPRLEAGRVRPGWSGLMTISRDWHPLLGALPDSPGLYCAAGFSGRGFQLSPAVGDLMAGLIAGEAEAAELLAPFRPARLAEGASLQVTGLGTMLG